MFINKIINFQLANFALLIHRAVEKGFLLFGAAALALFIPNSSYSSLYNSILNEHISLSFRSHELSISVQHCINDFLMAIFFLSVGTEIKRELIAGHLSTTQQRIMPLFAAIGGVIVPMIIYIGFNYNHSLNIRGWAIPSATDIAFALGVLMLFGQFLPTQLRVFLTALAVIDDLIAIVMIAFFYTDTISWYYLACFFACIATLLLLNRYKIGYLSLYMLIGVIMWYCCYRSGVHATIAGVVLGFTIPLEAGDKDHSPLHAVEKGLAPLVAYVILPIFALANSGIVFAGMHLNDLFHPVTLGIIVGLFAGKQLGVFSVVFYMIKRGIVKYAEKASLLQYYAVSVLCGIGFTMSLFIGILGFGETELLNYAKLGVMIGSSLSLIYGAILLLFIRYSISHSR